MTTDLSDKHFVYIEDDELSRQVMRMIFENMLGVKRLTMFEDSHDFLPRIKQLPQRPAVLLLDIQVHPLNGFDMLNIIRRDPEIAQVKVIALTASVMFDDIQKMRSAGFDGMIGKPVSVTTFPDLIRQVVAGESVWHVG